MNGIIIFTGFLFLLWIGKTILIPLCVATFFWYLLNAMTTYFRKIIPYSITGTLKNKLLDALSLVLSISVLIGAIYLFITQIQPMIGEMLKILPDLQSKLANFTRYISDTVGIKFNTSMLPDLTKVAKDIGTSAASMATSLGMILIYILFMFIEQSTFHKKFSALFSNKRQSKKMHYILSSIDDNMKKYLFMKTLISGITGIVSFIWLQAVGLEFAGVWAFIVFVTSYIPTIGAIFACTLPILYSLIMAPTLNQPILVAVGLIGFQILFGNILEPKLTGKTLNLSTLAILINLVFWGMIWGIAGMFFSVPLLVATFVITSQFDSTRWIAVLLSADGKIPTKREE